MSMRGGDDSTSTVTDVASATSLAPDPLRAILAEVDAHPTAAGYARAARAIGRINALAEGTTERPSPRLRPLDVALLASFTIDPLRPYLIVEMARTGFDAQVYLAPYNSVSQELLDPGSGLARRAPQLVIVAQLLDDVSPALSYEFLAYDAQRHADEAAQVVGTLADAIADFQRRVPSTVVVHNFARTRAPLTGLAETMLSDSADRAVTRLNEALVSRMQALGGAYVLDFDRLSATVGYDRAFDARGWHLGHAPLAAPMLLATATEHAHIARAAFAAPKKCLVLDLDNTLWGGVVGEDGVGGIHVGSGYPGNVFLEFQRAVLQLRQRGVLLAINTKNNADDVREAFRERPEMPLREDHFAAVRINWLDKPRNMRSIADELNIGLDALVFFDDNPAERELMRRALPEVLTLDVPSDPLGYVPLLRTTRPFDRLTLSDEDRRRGELQRQATARSEELAATSLDAFLRGLELTVEIRPVDPSDAPRVVDLIGKTNQFNVTTRRHMRPELDAMTRDPSIGAFSLRARDRFGDHGLVGVMIARVEGPVATIDTLLLSCRVIGRGIETAMLAHLAGWAAEAGARELHGEFIPTAKNAPAAALFPDHGFRSIENDVTDDGRQRWSRPLDGDLLTSPTHIVTTGGAANALTEHSVSVR